MSVIRKLEYNTKQSFGKVKGDMYKLWETQRAYQYEMEILKQRVSELEARQAELQNHLIMARNRASSVA
jgi:prefoldin subunit 5